MVESLLGPGKKWYHSERHDISLLGELDKIQKKGLSEKDEVKEVKKRVKELDLKKKKEKKKQKRKTKHEKNDTSSDESTLSFKQTRKAPRKGVYSK